MGPIVADVYMYSLLFVEVSDSCVLSIELLSIVWLVTRGESPSFGPCADAEKSRLPFCELGSILYCVFHFFLPYVVFGTRKSRQKGFEKMMRKLC